MIHCGIYWWDDSKSIFQNKNMVSVIFFYILRDQVFDKRQAPEGAYPHHYSKRHYT